MKYYHIGFSHCGCSSLYCAFQQIGIWYPELNINILRTPRTFGLIKTNKEFKEYPFKYLEEYNVFIETNMDNYDEKNLVWKYIAEYTDNVKFILTLRDPIDVALSYFKHEYNFTQKIDSKHILKDNKKIIQDLYAIKIMQTKYADLIKDYFVDTPERLLVMNICNGDGYEKLLPFMGLDVPNKIPSFPHKNEHDITKI